MAMIRVGMGATGETAVTGTPPPAPSTMDQFLQGAKTWLTPRDIPAVFSAVWAGLKGDPGAVLKSPQFWGLLAVPAAVLAVVMGMEAAKRRRTRNPRRRRVVVRRSRRRVANPRRARRRRNPLPRNAGRKRTARRRAGGGVNYYTKSGGVAAVKAVRRWKSSKPGKRSRSRGTHKNPSHRLGKNRRFMAVSYGVGPAGSGDTKYWAVYDSKTHKYVSPATTDYPAQVKLAARMERDEPSYGAQKKAAAYAKRRMGKIANPARPLYWVAYGKTIAAGTQAARTNFREATKAADRIALGGQVATVWKSETGRAHRMVYQASPALRASRQGALRKAKASYYGAARNPSRRTRNGRNYVLRGSMPGPSYTPGPGKIFTLAGRKGVVKSVVGDWVQFRRAVDGTTGMSLANFRQAARVENPGVGRVRNNVLPAHKRVRPGKATIRFQGKDLTPAQAAAALRGQGMAKRDWERLWQFAWERKALSRQGT